MSNELCPRTNKTCGGLHCEPPDWCQIEFEIHEGVRCPHGVHIGDPAGCKPCTDAHKAFAPLTHVNGG